jgi:putative endonuclease
MTRVAAEARGRRAERIAAWYLRMKGWRIIGTRVRTPVGEVDIVARRLRTTAFVEVKTRGTPAELGHAVDSTGCGAWPQPHRRWRHAMPFHAATFASM